MAKQIVLVGTKGTYKEPNGYQNAPIKNVQALDSEKIRLTFEKSTVDVGFSELDDQYGTADAFELADYLALNGFFDFGGGGVSLPIAQTDVDGLVPRFEAIEDQIQIVTLYEIITAPTTAGSISTQTGVEILTDTFAGADLYISEVSAQGVPTYNSIFDSNGDIVTANFNPVDVPPDWQLDNPNTDGNNYALVFRVRGTRKDIDDYSTANSYGRVDDRAEVSMQSAYEGGEEILLNAVRGGLKIKDTDPRLAPGTRLLEVTSNDGGTRYFAVQFGEVTAGAGFVANATELGGAAYYALAGNDYDPVLKPSALAVFRIPTGNTDIFEIGSFLNPQIIINLVSNKVSFNVANYEDLVTDDNDIPNRKFVVDLVKNLALDEQTHISGSAVTIQDGKTILYVDPVAEIPALAITMPANPANGDEVKISFGGDLTAGSVVGTLTIVGSGSDTVLTGGGITTAVAGTGFVLKYQESKNLWRLF